MKTLAEAQTLLFVPGDRPDRFAKALAAGADLVILDLEDAVGASKRPAARTAIEEFVAHAEPGRLLIRINPLGSSESAADTQLLRTIASTSPGVLAGVVVPKAESRSSLEAAAEAAGGAPVLALIETVRGLHQVANLIEPTAEDIEVRLAFGAIDFALDAGGNAPALLDTVRVTLTLASRLVGAAPPVESPNPQIQDRETVRAAAQHAACIGMGGMLAIHPAQLQPIAEAFKPTPEEIAWARRVVTAGDGASKVDGEMVDAPVIGRAQRILSNIGEQE